MNNSTHSPTGSLITFRGFDNRIEEYLEPKIPLSHKLINSKDLPLIVDSLREYLIRACGQFTIIGFYRPNDLSIWYDREAIIDEFDDLLLEFKDWIVTIGVVTGEHYTLVRYRDNLNFIMTETEPDLEAKTDLFSKHQLWIDDTVDQVTGHLEEFAQRLADQVDIIDDPFAFVKELIDPQRLREVLQRHMSLTEE